MGSQGEIIYYSKLPTYFAREHGILGTSKGPVPKDSGCMLIFFHFSSNLGNHYMKWLIAVVYRCIDFTIRAIIHLCIQ